jgi:Rieske Fe-S protein
MPLDEDKYPEQTGRRRFVKGVVGSAALSSVAAGTAASINTATSAAGGGGGPTQFVGIEISDGPAPRGMPIVPIEIASDGTLQGVWPEVKEVDQAGQTVTVAEEDIGGVTYSSTWFQYCGVQQYAGTAPEADADNVLRAKSGYEWMSDIESGTALTVEDFSDYREWNNGIGQPGLGKPANANWRSTEDGRPLPVEILRSPEVSKMVNGERGFHDYSQLPQQVRDFLGAATEDNFMAWLDKCTHFCCTPGFKTSTFGGAQNAVYCQCHQSIYDPFNPVSAQFVALPRPD